MTHSDAYSLACAFAQALYDDDFDRALSLLADGYQYEGRNGPVKGAEAVVASYRDASKWGRVSLDQLVYTRAVHAKPGGGAFIRFSDHIEHAGQKHTYSCEQHLRFGTDGKVTHIQHVELPGEREQLLEFFARVGVSR